MTALETLLANSLNLLTLGSELYCTTTCLEDVADEYKSTTIVCSVSTALNNINVPDNIIIVRDAQSYVESMSTEQLVEFDQLLFEKEMSFLEENHTKTTTDSSKVYIKQGPKHQ